MLMVKFLTNPLDANGEISLCYTCGSIFHWSYACPDSYESRDQVKEKDGSVQIQLLEEMAVLDSGCTTVQAVCNITLISQERTKTKSCEFVRTFSKISEFTN